jgi:hypothetical protein
MMQAENASIDPYANSASVAHSISVGAAGRYSLNAPELALLEVWARGIGRHARIPRTEGHR